MELDNGFNDYSTDCFFESNTQSDDFGNSNEFIQELYQRLERTSGTNGVADQQDYSPSSFFSSQNHEQYGQQVEMREDQQEYDNVPNVCQIGDEIAMAIDYVYAKCRSQEEEMSGLNSASTHCSDSQTNDSDHSSPSKKESKQNPKRNIPGLIGGKVRKSAIAFLEGGNSEKYQYIAAIFRYYNFSAQVANEFLHFLKNDYSTTKKTWEGVKANFQGNSDFGKLFALCVVGFLSNEGQADFYGWLENGKMKNSREILLKDREEFKQCFISRFGL